MLKPFCLHSLGCKGVKIIEGCEFPVTDRNSAWKVGNNGRDHRDKLSRGARNSSGYEKAMGIEQIHPQISRERLVSFYLGPPLLNPTIQDDTSQQPLVRMNYHPALFPAFFLDHFLSSVLLPSFGLSLLPQAPGLSLPIL